MDKEQYGKELAKEHWDWLGPLLEHVYKDAMEHGFKHGREAVAPPSPPADDREARSNPASRKSVPWPPPIIPPGVGPPAEVPEVEPVIIGVTPNQTTTPYIYGICAKFKLAIAKKPAGSCVGCTVPGCEAKGHIGEKRD